MISHEEIMESNFSTRMEVLQEENNEQRDTRIPMKDQIDYLIHKFEHTEILYFDLTISLF